MSINEIITITVVLTAFFAYINLRFIKWPPTIGIMVLSLASSILLALLRNVHAAPVAKIIQFVATIDFNSVVMNFMLSFLLFAGAIQVNAVKLLKERWAIITLSTLGVIISSAIIGGITFFLFRLFGLDIPLQFCLLFGVLISPTDPIAVLAILKEAKIPSSLEYKISGESLFNDGVAVVLFLTISEIAVNVGHTVSVWSVGKLFLQEAVGGLLFGALLGYAGFYTLRTIDDYKVEVLITLAIVMGGYFLAGTMHVSGPLAMVVAGIITGNKVKNEVMSSITQDYLGKFWELVDEIFNAILFLLIGLEMLVIKIDVTVLIISVILIAVVLFSRWVSVSIPMFLLRRVMKFEKHVITMLTWGGLRGGLSVALALSLSPSMHRDEFVLITYIIVIFSILVQGLTISKVAKSLKLG